MEKDGPVLVLQSIVETVIPLVEEDIDVDGAEIEERHGEQESARGPTVLGQPVGPGDCPGVAKDLEYARRA